MKQIDMKTYPKRNQYEYFRTYLNSCYGFDVEIDVTKLVSLCKKRGHSFFPYFLYAIMKGINSVDEMKMRIVSGIPYLYETIHPTFTVMTKSGIYINVGFQMKDAFSEFYKTCRKIIDEAKIMKPGDELNCYPECKLPNVVYATCIPNLKYTTMTHPLPLGNEDSMTIPRSCFGKYYQKEDYKIYVLLNLTVSHIFVDGFPLSACFQKIQEICNNPSLFM